MFDVFCILMSGGLTVVVVLLVLMWFVSRDKSVK